MECRAWIKLGKKRCVGDLEYKGGLANRADQRVLRWFGHVKRIDEYCVSGTVLMAEVSGGQVRGKPMLI